MYYEADSELPPPWVAESVRTNSRLTGLLWLMSERDLQAIVSTMTPKDVEPGERVITQGHDGTRFYVIERGSFEVFMSNPGVPLPGIKVSELGPQASFGELALLYSQERSATVIATSPARLWVMERAAFQSAVSTGFKQNMPPKFMDFLETVPLFQGVGRDKLQQLGRALLPKWYSKGQHIIKQGDWEDCFFILRTGEAVATVDMPDRRIEVERYIEPGTLIGTEVLQEEYRKQAPLSVRSVSDVTVVFWMSKLTFDNVMGPYKEQALDRLAQAKKREQEQCVCM